MNPWRSLSTSRHAAASRCGARGASDRQSATSRPEPVEPLAGLAPVDLAELGRQRQREDVERRLGSRGERRANATGSIKASPRVRLSGRRRPGRACRGLPRPPARRCPGCWAGGVASPGWAASGLVMLLSSPCCSVRLAVHSFSGPPRHRFEVAFGRVHAAFPMCHVRTPSDVRALRNRKTRECWRAGTDKYLTAPSYERLESACSPISATDGGASHGGTRPALKPITDINDPRLVKAMAHPLRVQILSVLEQRVASPRELSDELDAPLGNVSYHVRTLSSLGLIKLVKKTPRRGAIEHYYEARGRAVVTDKAWAEVPDIVKRALLGRDARERQRRGQRGGRRRRLRARGHPPDDLARRRRRAGLARPLQAARRHLEEHREDPARQRQAPA